MAVEPSGVIDPLRKLFCDIDNEVTFEDFKKLKKIVDIPEGIKETFENCSDIFLYLEKVGKISCSKLKVLKECLVSIQLQRALYLITEYEHKALPPVTSAYPLRKQAPNNDPHVFRQTGRDLCPPPYSASSSSVTSTMYWNLDHQTERKDFLNVSDNLHLSDLSSSDNTESIQQAKMQAGLPQESLMKDSEMLTKSEDRGISKMRGDDLEEDGYQSDLDQPAIQLYNYQLELAEEGLHGHNNIICAPTGSGKTFTAGYVCLKRWQAAQQRQEPFHAVFIVCIRNLISQQASALSQIFTSYEESKNMRVAEVSDSVSVENCLRDSDIVVLTAQMLLNRLSAPDGVSFSQLDLMILDECHHTNLRHPYNNIMHIYRTKKLQDPSHLPQIMGLTASLGVGDMDNPVEHYISICANLDCPSINHVRVPRNKQELLKHNPRPEKDQIIKVQPRSPTDQFYRVVMRMILEIERCTKFPLQNPKPNAGDQQYENWIVLQKQSAESEANLAKVAIACGVLLKLNAALKAYKDLQAVDVLEGIEQCFHPTSIGPGKDGDFLAQLYEKHSNDLHMLANKETVESNPKLASLQSLLEDLYTSQGNSLGIVLAKTIANVDGLLRFIKGSGQLGKIRPGKLVGQGRREGTMTDTAQENTIKKFKTGSLNLLVATDVAQEGLDIPKCNFVIRYNFVSNEIGSTQSRGRARAKNSECYLIVERGSVDEKREHKNLDKEFQMLEALDGIDQIDRRKLKNGIDKAQEQLVEERRNEEERQRMTNSLNLATNVTIHCKQCKTLLCAGQEIRKRGSNYLCIAEDFTEKIVLKAMLNPKEFRDDKQISYIHCSSACCHEYKLGQKIEYRRGLRRFGYVLGKDSIMLHIHGCDKYHSVKKWSQVPFMVEEEKISALSDLLL